MTESLSDFMDSRKTTAVQHPAQSSFHFAYIWQNLDNLFQQLDQQDVNDLNLEFMKLTIAKISAKNLGQ